MNILIVKLTSLGDVLHAIPVIWDIRARYPNAKIDWLVEESYVDLLKPLTVQTDFQGINRIIPSRLRRFKKNFFNAKTFMNNWLEFKKFLSSLRAEQYDLIIDLQGLIKSAMICALARRSKDGKIVGSGNRVLNAGYEAPARWFYTQKIAMPGYYLNAVNRSRWVTQAALGVPADERLKTPPLFYPTAFVQTCTETLWEKPYVLCFHATSRDNKRWPDESWVVVGKALTERGLLAIFPWGNAAEKQISERLAAQIPHAVVPSAFSITQAFSVIACAQLIVGVDTGLVHVSAALYKPTIEIYCHSYRENAEGFWSDKIINLGNMGQVPSVAEVLAAVTELSTQPSTLSA
jgi:heptosyltransferase-1